MGKIVDKIKGKMMKAEGRATDDKLRTAQGHVVEGKGKVKGAVERGVAKVKAGVAEARTRARAGQAKAKRKGMAARRMP